MNNDDRRNFLKNGSMVLTAGILGGIGLSANGGQHDSHEEHGKHMKGIDAVVIDANEKGICATCRFWGGERRATEDKQSVYCHSLGWCNNPDSHHYQTKTTPITGPMKSWKKWEALQ